MGPRGMYMVDLFLLRNSLSMRGRRLAGASRATRQAGPRRMPCRPQARTRTPGARQRRTLHGLVLALGPGDWGRWLARVRACGEHWTLVRTRMTTRSQRRKPSIFWDSSVIWQTPWSGHRVLLISHPKGKHTRDG